jgi:type IV secretion system protein VirB4
LQTLRAPDFANLAFWVHDIRRRRGIGSSARFGQLFNQKLSDEYFETLSAQKIMQNELYLTMIYRPVVSGRRLVERSADVATLQSEQDQAVGKLQELAGNLEAVLKDYAPYRLGMYEGSNGITFSETLELFGYLLNRIDEPVPVLDAPIHAYLPVSRHLFSDRTGDFVVGAPDGNNRFGAILNIKEYTDATYPGILNALKYLEFE